MILKASFLVVFVLSIFSCTEKYQPVSSLYSNSSIIGTWEWQRTELINWSVHEILTPEEVGYTEIWIFGQDNLFQSYRNDKLHNTTYYIITENENSIQKLAIGDWAPATIQIIHDELIYSTAYVDGPTSYYVRKR